MENSQGFGTNEMFFVAIHALFRKGYGFGVNYYFMTQAY